MKKLLSLLLAAALLLSLSVTALAFEDLEPPLWQRWGYDSLEEYLADWDETEEEYQAEVEDYKAYRAEQDALIASFDPEAHDFTPALWEYYGYESKEDMMEVWEIDETGYYEAVEDELFSYQTRDWTSEQWEEWWAAEELAELQATKAGLGLVYEINIMADGAALSFESGAPEIRNSCTMAPLGAMARALNAEASWDGDTGAVTVTRGATVVEMTVDGGTLQFRTEGPDDNVSGGVFYLDSLPYVKDGEVYVPVRALAEALGYEVQWSDTYRTAVLVDVDTLASDFDADFTVLNAIFAMNGELDRSQTYRGEGRLDVNVNVPALGKYSGSITATVVQNGSAAQCTVTYDMNELVGLIAVLTGDGSLPDPDELAALTEAMDDGLDLICDMDGMKLYFRGKLFDLIFELDGSGADTWYVMDLNELMGELDVDTLNALTEGTTSIGQMICMMTTQSGVDAIYLRESLDEIAATFEPFSDSHFTGDGNVRSLIYAMPELGGTVTLQVTMDGDRATKLTGSINYDEDGTQIVCVFDTQPMDASMSGSINVGGMVIVDFALTAVSQAAPDAVVATAPPAGATVIDLFDALYGSYPLVVEDAEDFPAE